MSALLNPDRLNRLYDFLEAAVHKDEIPGAALQISVGADCNAVKAFGKFQPNLADPMQQDSIFLVASITKPFTVAAVVLLAEHLSLIHI